MPSVRSACSFVMHWTAVLLIVTNIIAFGGAQTSNKLEVGVSSPTSVGQTQDLFCNSPSLSPVGCFWVSPEGSTYIVEDGLVTDLDGNVVTGITADGTDQKKCAITIEALEEDQIGTWKCHLEFGTQVPFQEAFLSVITQPRVQDVRIATHFEPISYDISLVPFIVVDNFTFNGEVSINLKATEDSTNITLHSKAMTVYEDLIVVSTGLNKAPVSIVGFGYDSARDFFILNLEKPILAGEEVNVQLKFLGNLNDDLSGFYRSSYSDSRGTHYMAITQFQATDARKAFPCLDEPALKATFSIRLGRTNDFKAASNMPIVNEGVPMDGTDDYVWDEFQTTEKMSTYLLAFLVTDMEFIKSDASLGRIPFRIWTQRDYLSQTDYAAEIGPRILAHYESVFGIDFPLPKQDMAAIPDLSFGGMENWGLVTYRDTALLYEPGVSSLKNKDRVTDVVAHELAHQWFGDLVTMGWWSDLWLNEGFASYVSYIGQEHILPEFGGKDRIALDNNQVVFVEDALETSHPISVTVNHPDEINEIFDNISYEKGCALIQMMVNFLGESTFFKGIRNYLQAYAYGNAFQSDLWTKLTEAAVEDGALPSGVDVQQIMDTWTLQKGFPVIKATRDPTNLVTLTQERFLVGGPSIKDDHDYKWWVPISYAGSGGDFSQTKNQEWMSPNEASKQIQVDVPEDSALILNIQQTAYYRVNYDEANWDKIAQVLKSNPDNVHRINRAQILDDSLSLARIGLLDYSLSLSQTEYLDQEEDYIPWQGARKGLSYLLLMMKRKPGKDELTAYMSTKVNHIYQRLGIDALESDTFFDTLLRDLSVGYLCSFGNPDCTNPAKARFDEWMSSSDPDAEGSNPIDATVRSTVYCSAVAEGQSDVWDFLFERYLRGTNGNEKSNILSALGCSTNEQTLQRYLTLSMDPDSGIRKQDGKSVVSSVANNAQGSAIAFQWLDSNWDAIRSYFDTAVSSPLADMVGVVARSFNTQEELDGLKSFVQRHQNNLGTAQRATELAIETTEANIAWMEDYYNVIVEWLQSKTQS